MRSQAGEERKAFEDEARMRQHVRDSARARARQVLIAKHPTKFSGDAGQAFLERVLTDCERDAHQIAREAGEEASNQGLNTALSVAAYELAYNEAYVDALPALVATTQARCDMLDPAAVAS